jgi:hypothetical protein
MRLGRPAGLADGGLPVGGSGQPGSERVSISVVGAALGQPERLTSGATCTAVHRG